MDQRLPGALEHLQEAFAIASELGLVPDAVGMEQRNQSVLLRIADLEPTKSTVISSTLSQARFFDDLVREQVSRAEIAAQHLGLAESLERFHALLAPLAPERLEVEAEAAWAAAAAQFAEIQAAYDEIGSAALEEIEREHVVQETYREFRAAVKASEATALELLETAFARYNTARQKVTEEDAQAPEEDPVPLIERLRHLQDEERRWGVARDVVNRLITASGDAEIIMGRLMQSTAGKERLYWQSQAFIGSVSTLLEAFPRALEPLSSPEQRMEGVGNLRMAVELFQQRTRETCEEIERLAAEAAEEIGELLADSEQRLERLTPSRSGLQ